MAGQRTLFCVFIFLFMFTMSRATGQAAPPKDLSQGGTILLLADSILDCHGGDRRIEVCCAACWERKLPVDYHTADGKVLEKEEVAALVASARQYHIEVTPEVRSLTHSYYLLTRHRELAEIADAEWPDICCPSNPKVYDLLFDLLEEYIQVMKPRMGHAGHDPGRCDRGEEKQPA